MKGNCAECGRYPVELEARRVSWWWCSEGKRWSESVCERAGELQCCTREESLAAVVPASADVLKAWYCPGHASFKVIRLPIVSVMVCQACIRPAVRAFAVERSWYWCEYEGMWSEKECPLNPARSCCTKRGGMFLAAPESGPMAR